MKRMWVLAFTVVIAIVVATLVAGSTPEGDDQAKMVAAAKALDQKFIDAMNKGDVTAAMETYWKSPELVIYPPDELEIRSWETANEMFRDFLASLPGAKFRMMGSQYIPAGNMVISHGKVSVTTADDEGEPFEIIYRYTSVIAKKDGKWVYILDHASEPVAAMDEGELY